MNLEEEVAHLRAENAQLKEQLAQALARIAELEARLEQMQTQLASGSGETGAPSFVKPSTPKKNNTPKPPRRPRAKEHNGARRREQSPTSTIEHHLEQCPDCGYTLRQHQLASRRQVIELPPPPPVQVTEHQLFKGWCARCGRWHYPSVDLTGQVIGQGRMGVRIASLIAHLRTSLRMPLLLIKEYLYTIHKLTISSGEIVELLHRMVQAEPLKEAAASIQKRVRRSHVVHGDETTWREGGQNGYIWGFFTPDGERLYEYDQSRSGAVAKRIMGSNFGENGQVMSSDFYCGYNDFPGEHQRCWAHLFRDLHKLKEEHPTNPANPTNPTNPTNSTNPTNEEVHVWAEGVRALYDAAHKLLEEHQLGPPTDDEEAKQPHKWEQRVREYQRLVEGVAKLGAQYADAKQYGPHRSHGKNGKNGQEQSKHPCHTLCKRLLRHQEELFQFVLVSGLSSDNNLAERSIRPVVVMRKVSGGSQSPKGSATRMTLATLFGTWRAKGLNPFDQCLALLSQPSHP
jgi:transposase